MNVFSDYRNEDQRSCGKRSMEIKELIEQTAVKATNKMNTAKQKQKAIQNKRENVTDKLIDIGSAVTLKSLKIQRKLEPKYIGIFKVSGITKNGNYWLTNEKGHQHKQSVPKSRLKVLTFWILITKDITKLRVS